MPSRGEAFRFLETDGHSIFGSHERLLYIGHRGDTHPWWHETFAKSLGATRIGVIDIYAPNLSSAKHITSELIHGDALDPAVIGPGPGLLFWDEGPEHVTREMFMPWARQMSAMGWDILASCPWGFQSQGPESGNPTEEHLWGPMPADMEEAGMQWRTFGEPFPAGHGNLIAWRLRDAGA